MDARRKVEEMTRYLQQVRSYVGGDAFDAERRKAREEFFGGEGPCKSGGGAPCAVEQDPARWGPLYFDWFMFERRHSHRAQTPVRMYVTDHPDLPERIRANLLACEASLYSTFWVAAVTSDGVVVLDTGGEAHDYYRVARDGVAAGLRAGDLFRGRLVRWDDEYCLHGPLEPWPGTAAELLAPSERAALRSRRGLKAEGGDPWAAELLLVTRAAWLRMRRRQP